MSTLSEFEYVANLVISGIRSLSELKIAATDYLASTSDWQTIRDAFMDSGASKNTVLAWFEEQNCQAFNDALEAGRGWN